jgi:NAD-dependent SIR2 family protein deacetylase
MSSGLEDIKSKLAAARAVTVLTGAGISADSGVPTFRGTDGLWRNFRAEDLATPEAFARDPRLVWEWYNWRRELIATKRPNAAHHALAELEKTLSRFLLITQNVDGLHGAAGSQQRTGRSPSRCSLSVHLAAASYGPISSGSGKRWMSSPSIGAWGPWPPARSC